MISEEKIPYTNKMSAEIGRHKNPFFRPAPREDISSSEKYLVRATSLITVLRSCLSVEDTFTAMAAKFPSTPTQCSDTYLEDVEQQACLLFEEFLRLPDPVSSRLCASAGEVVDGAPSFRMERAYEQEECLTDDELVTDGAGLVSKGQQSAPNGERPVAQSAQDQTLKDLALKMRNAGDKLVNEYGYRDRASGIESTLVKVITNSATNLTYEKFSNEVDKLIGQERSWTNLVLAYYVSGRVVSQVGKVRGYFTRYVSKSFLSVYQEAGGVEPLVNSHMPQ